MATPARLGGGHPFGHVAPAGSRANPDIADRQDPSFQHIHRFRVLVVFRLWQSVVLAIAFAMAFGAFDEWHQQLIPGRSTELADWVADSIGAAVGASVAAIVEWRRGRPNTLQST
jgi:VanZ family protein